MVETMKQRDDFWQFIRGLCIAAVVLIHCPNGIGYSPVCFYSWFSLRQIINFPVATFVFMAGYFVSRQKVEAKPISYMVVRGATPCPLYLMEPAIFRRYMYFSCFAT